jgi:hypothetical protein
VKQSFLLILHQTNWVVLSTWPLLSPSFFHHHHQQQQHRKKATNSVRVHSFFCPSSNEFILHTYIYIYSHRKREKKKKCWTVYERVCCLAVGHPSFSHTCTFFYEFLLLNWTPQTIVCLIWIYTYERMRERWNRFVIERWDNTRDGDHCIQRVYIRTYIRLCVANRQKKRKKTTVKIVWEVWLMSNCWRQIRYANCLAFFPFISFLFDS